MSDVTTVQLKKSLVKELKSIKRYPRQTYEELIEDLIRIAKKPRNGNYDDFLHNIQQLKMKEPWDNSEDEGWERA
jgi:hypothetical protein